MIVRLLLRWAKSREPDFIIGGPDDPYLRRHWLIPRNKFFNVYVHEFLRSDDDRALHDHPWLFNVSWLISGQYFEHTIAAGGINERVHRIAGDFKFRWGQAPHRIELLTNILQAGTPLETRRQVPCWTVFITGPVVRQWGFHCQDAGWIHWKRFTSPDDKGAVGKGCDA